MDKKTILEIENLHVHYKTDGKTARAVNGIDISIAEGETLGLVGETGAGKTSTALSIMGLLPNMGRISEMTADKMMLKDADLLKATKADMQAIRGVYMSMIFQDPMTSLNPTMTVGAQIKESVALHNPDMTKQEINDEVERLLTMVGIQPYRKTEYPHQFSGGMKQRVVIAIALACNPALLIADEPTTALDVTIQAQVLDMMRELKEKLGMYILLITHDLGVVAENCDKVAIMYAGEIIESGTVEDIFGQTDHHPYTTGLLGSIPDLKVAARRLAPIEGMTPEPSNLPEGCKFHERCAYCMERCKTEAPRAYHKGTHMMRCHLKEETERV